MKTFIVVSLVVFVVVVLALVITRLVGWWPVWAIQIVDGKGVVKRVAYIRRMVRLYELASTQPGWTPQAQAMLDGLRHELAALIDGRHNDSI